MAAIFFRELRENAKWAAMIFGVFCVLIFLRAWHTGPFYLLFLAQDITLVYAPIAGLAMGIAQSIFETRADNWGFAVHRPVARMGLFAAKCAAGLVLVYLALSLPLVPAALWARESGNLPMPFQGRTLLPALADVLCAGCYYFVGILLALRKARWLGTRLLPIGFALVCSTAVRLAPEFWQAIVAIAAGMCIGAVAAWGVFETAGAADRGAVPAIGLGTMLYAGALLIGFLGVAFLGIFESTVQWHDLRLDKRGNVLQTTKTFADGDLTYLVTDTSGRAVPEFDGVNLDDPTEADRFVRFSGALVDDRLIPWPLSAMTFMGYRSAAPGVVMLRTVAAPSTRVPATPLFDGSRRIIDLFDPSTNLLIGTVGPSGFAPAGAGPIDRFPSELLNSATQRGTRTLAFASGVYWMELDQRRVRSIFSADDKDPVVCAHELAPAADPQVVIATRSRLHLLRPSGEILFSIPLQQDISKYGLEFATLPDNHHLVVRGEAISPEFQDAFPPRFWEYALDGKLVRYTEPPIQPDDGGVTIARTAAFGLVHPVAALPLFPRWMSDLIFSLDTRHHPRLFYGLLVVSALLSAAMTILLARRCGFGARKAAAWSLASLLLGPAGIVVMLGLNPWPARERCAACGRLRMGGRRECSHCIAPFPAPAQDGREIFEPAEALEMAF